MVDGAGNHIKGIEDFLTRAQYWPDTPHHGKVVEEKTKDFQHDGQHFTASSDEPAYIVESDTSGKTAAHKGSALTKKK